MLWRIVLLRERGARIQIAGEDRSKVGELRVEVIGQPGRGYYKHLILFGPPGPMASPRDLLAPQRLPSYLVRPDGAGLVLRGTEPDPAGSAAEWVQEWRCEAAQ